MKGQRSRSPGRFAQWRVVRLSTELLKGCRRFLMNFFGGARRLAINTPLDFGVDPDRKPDPGILIGILTTPIVRILRDKLPWWRFAVSECLRFLFYP